MRGKCRQQNAVEGVVLEVVMAELRASFEAERAYNLVQSGNAIVAHFPGSRDLVSSPGALDDFRRLEVSVFTETGDVVVRYDARIAPLFARCGLTGLILRQVAKPFAKRRLIQFLSSVLSRAALSAPSGE